MDHVEDVPDCYYDLVLTDPPYGINIVDNKKIGGDNNGKCKEYIPVYGDDVGLLKEQWEEIKRISKNQIIWGGNYFAEMLGNSPCWLVWNKKPYGNGDNFADCELAWTSFNTPSKVFHYLWRGMISWGNEKRVHPTQKPIPLFKWCIETFTKEGDKIFDPFLGSGTTLRACRETNRNCNGFEIVKDYNQVIVERLMAKTPSLETWVSEDETTPKIVI